MRHFLRQAIRQVLIAAVLATTLIGCKTKKELSDVSSVPVTISTVSDIMTESFETETPAEETESETVTISETPSSSVPKSISKSEKATSKPQTVEKPVPNSVTYQYNTDIEDNVFLDSLIYTGYNITKHRNDGNMWKYILASQKRGLGYLSNISYGGGSSGYETKNGKPDLAAFQRGGLVCASYVTYVYFNYLPNVAGINTSSLTRPQKSYSANDWYIAALDWVKKGYSKKITFTASLSGNLTKFSASENIPIGSVIVFCDFHNRGNFGSHVCVYAGYKNGYHWVFHVGNKNGPEFCAIERMSCGPDPQWPLAVISTPGNIRMAAMLEVKVTDENGTPVNGAAFQLKSNKTGAEVSLGMTGEDGIITKDGLKYGEYTLTEILPSGYTTDCTSWQVVLTTASNSKNSFTMINKKESAAISESENQENSLSNESETS